MLAISIIYRYGRDIPKTVYGNDGMRRPYCIAVMNSNRHCNYRGMCRTEDPCVLCVSGTDPHWRPANLFEGRIGGYQSCFQGDCQIAAELSASPSLYLCFISAALRTLRGICFDNRCQMLRDLDVMPGTRLAPMLEQNVKHLALIQRRTSRGLPVAVCLVQSVHDPCWYLVHRRQRSGAGVGIQNEYFHRLTSPFFSVCLSSARYCSSGKSARLPRRA